MKIQNFLSQAVYCFLLIFCISCGAATPEGSSSDSQGSATSVSLVGGITEIEFASDGSTEINFETVGEESEYLLVLYSSNYEDEEVFAYQVGDGSGASPSVSALRTDSSGSIDETIHGALRSLEASINNSPLMSHAPAALRTVSALTLGSPRTFKVINSLSSSATYTTVTAELRHVTSNFYVYVDVRNEDALTDDNLEEVLAPFDAVVDDERELFGDESDVNGDGHFVILMSQAINQLGAIEGGLLTGFFYAIDLYDESHFSASNEMEIFYTMVPDPSGEFGSTISTDFALTNILPSVFPHEFQHMIGYNQHVLVNGGDSERSFLSEALSHLAEDIYSIDEGYMLETGIENPSRVSYYLDSTSSVCPTCGSSLEERGGSYLFIRYLYEQAEKGNLTGVTNGAELIEGLLNTDLRGVENIVDAALSSENPDDIRGLWGLFSLAAYLSDTGWTTDNRFQFQGISLRDAQNDNRSTVLNGPSTESVSNFPYSDTLVTSGISYLLISGEELLNANSSLSLTISDELEIGGFIVQLDH